MGQLYRMVGRDDEFSRFAQAWRDASAGRPRLVLVSGEPGSGKTRFVQELYRRCGMSPAEEQAEERQAQRERGRSLPGGSLALDTDGYWPELRDEGEPRDKLVPQAEPPPQVKRQAFAAWLKHELALPDGPRMPFFWLAWLCSDGNQHGAGGLAPVYGAMPQMHQHLSAAIRSKVQRAARKRLWWGLGEAAVGFTPAGPILTAASLSKALYDYRQETSQAGRERQATRERDMEAYRREFLNMILGFFRMLGDDQDQRLQSLPAILVVDDLQWVDHETYALICDLFQAAQREHWRLLLAATTRSNELAEARWDSAQLREMALRNGDASSYLQLELTPTLSEADAREIIGNHLPRAGADATAAMAKRAGGQPLYIVNYARLVDESPGWLNAAGELTPLGLAGLDSIPVLVEAVIDRRLALLDPLARSILAWGSVQGQRFVDLFVARVAHELDHHHTALSVNAHIEKLHARHQLLSAGRTVAQGFKQYAFGHHLVFERVRQQFTPQHALYSSVCQVLLDLLQEQLACGALGQWQPEDQLEALETLARLSQEAGRTAEEFGARARLNALLREQWRMGEAIMHADRAADAAEGAPQLIVDVPFWEAVDLLQTLLEWLRYKEALPLAKHLAVCMAARAGGSADDLRERCVAVSMLGDLLQAGGEAQRRQALGCFEECVGITRRIVAEFGETPDSLRYVSISLNKLGDMLRAGDEDERAQAREYYAESLELCRRIVEEFGETLQSLRDVSVSLERLGDMLSVGAADERAQARENYAESLELCRRIVAEFGETPESLRDLSASLDRLGDMLSSGDEEERVTARKYYTESLELCRRIVAELGETPESLRDVSVSVIKLGDLLSTGNKEERIEALEYYTESLAKCRRIVDEFGESPQSLRDVSLSLNKLGDMLRADDANERAQAREYYTESLQLRRRIVAEFGETPESLRDMSVSLNKLGDMLRAGDADELAQARKYYAESLELCRRIVDEFGETPQSLRDVSISLERLGDILRAGDADERSQAREYYANSRAVSERAIELFGKIPGAVNDLASACIRQASMAQRDGHLDRALTLYRECLQFFIEAGNSAGADFCRKRIAELEGGPGSQR